MLLRTQETAFPGFKFQKFSGGACSPRRDSPRRGVAFSHAGCSRDIATVRLSHWIRPCMYPFNLAYISELCTPETAATAFSEAHHLGENFTESIKINSEVLLARLEDSI